MVRAKKEIEESKIVPEIKCTMCGEMKKANSNNFYKSYSILFKQNYENRMCVCKDCISDLYNNLFAIYGTNKKTIYECCLKLDVYFENKLYESVLKQFTKGKNKDLISTYFQKANSLPQYKNKTFKDSETLNTDEELLIDDSEVERNVVDFWGSGLIQEEYAFLENEYNTLISRYECDSYSQEVLFQEIAQTRLQIRNNRRAGNSVKDDLKQLQELMGNANIKPAQENASMASDQLTFGTLIKKFENEEPIPEPLSEWKSKDWIRKYVCVWFFGSLCRMMGKPNIFKEEYDKEMARYTVNAEDGDE